MQYQVPQFIETEDTILGPITIRQFIYICVAGAISFILYFFLTGTLWIITTAIMGLAAVALSFIKYNGRPLASMLFSFISYFWRPKVYVWRRKEEIEAMRAAEAAKRGSPLQDLWLRITTSKEAMPQREQGAPKPANYEALRKTTGDTQIARRVDYR